jgi:hypothetical protein
MEIPGTSIDRFERTRRIIRGLCCALRVIDVNSPLQALERMSIGAEQVLEETDVISWSAALAKLMYISLYP